MEYKTSWASPSNIALIKYWGKKKGGVQLPANPSISFTLSNCKTTTFLKFIEGTKFDVSVSLEQVDTPSFIPKIEQFLERIKSIFPFVMNGSYEINTSNSFPHSSGIASSASGMSALALCICDIASKKGLLDSEKFFQTASLLSRLGSGSASRSVFGPLGVWGEHPDFEGSSDDFAISYNNVSPIFKNYCDTILLVHKGQKTVSSTVGHDLVDNHPFAIARFRQANQNMSAIKSALESADIDRFIDIVESEALTLHSLMMSSNPYFILMKPDTLNIINTIWQKRKKSNVKWCFTIDAGANVHFLYPSEDKETAHQFIEDELKQYCENGAFIHDFVGSGPEKTT
jgi:diphosphomevalonate decarboxylase